MKQFSNYSETSVLTSIPELPAGAYQCQIIGAKEKTFEGKNGPFSQLHIAIDISDGEYKGFYDSNFKAQSSEDKKWKGILRLYIPTDDGSEQDTLTKQIFKTTMAAIEDSNNGYHWDWDENTLKDKKVGCVFRSEQWVYNNKQGWKSQPFKFISFEDLKNGNFKIPEPKANKDAINYEAASGTKGISDNEVLPF